MAIRFACPHCGTIAHVSDSDAGKVASCARCGNLTTVPRYSSGAAMPIPQHSDEVLFIDDQPLWRWGKRWIGWLALGLALLALFTLLLPAFRPAHWHDNTYRRCGAHLQNVAMALGNYEYDNGVLPPAFTTDGDGRPMHSWRVLLLPYLECQHLYDQYDLEQPWDSPHNLQLLERMPDIYRCPASEAEPGMTNYVVVVGNPDQFPQTLFTPDRSLSSEDVTDGTSRTVMVVEVARGVPWTMPGADLHFERMTFRINGGPASVSSHHGEGAHVVFGDGKVRYISELGMDGKGLRQLLQPADETP